MLLSVCPLLLSHQGLGPAMAALTFRMLQKAYGALTMSQKNVHKWYKDFKEGRESVDDLERPGRPSASTDEKHVNQVKELVHKNRRLASRDLAWHYWHFKRIT